MIKNTHVSLCLKISQSFWLSPKGKIRIAKSYIHAKKKIVKFISSVLIFYNLKFYYVLHQEVQSSQQLFYIFHLMWSKIYKIRENPSLVDFTKRWVKRIKNLLIELKFLKKILKSQVVRISTKLPKFNDFCCM